MCKVMEDLCKQTQKEERTDFANRLMDKGFSPLELVSEMSKLPLDEVKKLYEERTRNA